MAGEARAVIDLLRSFNLTIREASGVCDAAKLILLDEPLAKKNEAAQDECAASECEG